MSTSNAGGIYPSEIYLLWALRIAAALVTVSGIIHWFK